MFWENDSKFLECEIFYNILTKKLINEPTHHRDNGSLSYIDQIWIDQAFLFADSGVLTSLEPYSNH